MPIDRLCEFVMATASQTGVAGLARDLVLFPVHLGAVLTRAHSFADNPVLGSRLLNRLGLHAVRVVLAHAVTTFRWWLLTPLLPRAMRQRFHRDGFLMIEDVVPTDRFAAIRDEIRRLDVEVWECREGDTLTQRVLLDGAVLRQCPVLDEALFGPPLGPTLKYCSAKNAFPLFYLQAIKNGYGGAGEDIQKSLHADTFHPTIKAWLFLEDVRADEGAFRYVPGSHRLTRRRLAWEYRRSLRAAERADTPSGQGSPRVGPEDVADLGLAEARAFPVRANTLIVANTFGFHCRGPAARPAARFEIWAFGRPNPFNPFPGFGSRAVHAAHTLFVRARLRIRDDRARRSGRVAFYHRIPMGRFRA